MLEFLVGIERQLKVSVPLPMPRSAGMGGWLTFLQSALILVFSYYNRAEATGTPTRVVT